MKVDIQVELVPLDQVKPYPGNPRKIPEEAVNALAEMIRQQGWCVKASTPVLCADLVWRPAGSLAVGDGLIAFDEHRGERGESYQRRYRTAVVTANTEAVSDMVRVTTERGALLATPDHPLLARRAGRDKTRWIEAGGLRPGDEAYVLMRPWAVERTWEAGWLAGFLDGEGTAGVNERRGGKAQGFRLAAYQRPGVTADRMIAEMQARALTKVRVFHRPDRPGWQPQVMARVSRLTEIMRLLGTVRPERLLRGAGPFWEGQFISPPLRGESRARVLSVEPAGEGRIARLSTSTRTYIAAGFASHNTQPIVLHHGVIVAGHVRLLAAQRLGLAKVPVIRADHLTEAQAKAARLTDNRAAAMTGWDIDALMRESADLKIDDLPGFTAEELVVLREVMDPNDAGAGLDPGAAGAGLGTNQASGDTDAGGGETVGAGGGTDAGGGETIPARKVSERLSTDAPPPGADVEQVAQVIFAVPRTLAQEFRAMGMAWLAEHGVEL